jgi:hypothetical protein
MEFLASCTCRSCRGDYQESLPQSILPLTDMERARYHSCPDSIGSPHARAKGLLFSSASLPVELAHSSDKEQPWRCRNGKFGAVHFSFDTLA